MSHLDWDPDRYSDYVDELANATWSRFLTWEEYQHALDLKDREIHPWAYKDEKK